MSRVADLSFVPARHRTIECTHPSLDAIMNENKTVELTH
jgi:hypothetical protein